MTFLKEENCFTPFSEVLDNGDLPDLFTYPFYYEPHPIAIQAATELQRYLQGHEGQINQYGLGLRDKPTNGKMFGVLVVKNVKGELGYLSAYSGEIYERDAHEIFVPPVYDKFQKAGYFLTKSEGLNELNRTIEKLEASEEYIEVKSRLQQIKAKNNRKLQLERDLKLKRRDKRRSERKKLKYQLEASAFDKLLSDQNQESINDKFFIREYAIYLESEAESLQLSFDKLQGEIDSLKTERKSMSVALQDWLFAQYVFLDADGAEKDVRDIFNEWKIEIPPSGAGDCAAPKLLHFAYRNKLKPLALAEFWWGASPSSKVRRHGYYYPACRSKCEPILGHMLRGLEVAPNPMLINPAIGKEIKVVYEDEFMAVINKPPEFLSVPGKSIKDSVDARMKARYPDATGPLIVHRLDMSTSGIMLIAKTKDVHQNLQEQFVKRQVKKTYVALLDGIVKGEKGSVDLPLRVDLDNRPFQLVCYEHGKQALTNWEVIERRGDKTLIRFFPITGRTHQLRVHAAHQVGLNTPIVGDDLYGKKGERLCLHAASIAFKHPASGESVSYSVPHGF